MRAPSACALVLAALLPLALAPQPAQAKERERLRVVSWNVWGLPWGIAKAREARIAQIGPALVALKPDLVCLQEVWVPEDGERLIADLAAAGLVHAIHESEGFLGSGLLIASRYPLSKHHFVAYELTGKLHKPWHGDAWARKGVLEVRVETPLGAMRLATTHLHARYGSEEYLATQLAQAAQLGHALGDLGINPAPHAQDSARLPLILTGDLNSPRDSAPFELLCGISALQAPDAEALNIDWLLSRDGGALRLEVKRIRHALEEPVDLGDAGSAPLSDHPAVVAELVLRQAGPARWSPAQDRVLYAAAAARVRPIVEAERVAATQAFSRWRGRALALGVLGGLFMFLLHSKRGPKGKGRCGVGCLSFVFLHLAVWAMYLGVVHAANQAAGLQGTLNRLPELPPAGR